MWLRWVSRPVRYSEPSNLGAAIDDERRLRERRIEEHRASLEYEKLASCTFQPETNESAKPTRAAGAKDSGKGKGKGKGPKRPEARGGPVVRAPLSLSCSSTCATLRTERVVQEADEVV